MNEQQVEAVAKFIDSTLPKGSYSLVGHYVKSQPWKAVGMIAEACKKADAKENPIMVFLTPWWDSEDGVWLCRLSIPPFLDDSIFKGASADSPAEAAILAVAAYLSANPTTTEK